MMTERLRSATSTTTGSQFPKDKMESDLSPRKTMVVVVIVVGCFAVLWPKVFYPMLLGSANQHMKPSPIDKTTGCCDVISEIDINTIKIMSELCGSIITMSEDDKPLKGKEIVTRCQKEILDICGIDISALLQDQVRLSQNVKQILEEVRSLNGSLCLKYNFGVAPWRLGVPHRVTVRVAESNIRQERPLHLRSELIHPAFRERGRAIPLPQPQIVPPPSRPPPRIVEGRPGPVPGMRPTIGGAGHVVPPPKQGTSSMSVIMPIYTIGIVIFFTYTLMKIIFKKQPEGVGGALYPPIKPDPHFRKEVFESEKSRLTPRLSRDNLASKLVVNAMSALLDEVDQEMEARRNKSNEITSQDLSNGSLSNGNAHKPHAKDQPSVTVLGMETQASCENGKKWTPPSPSRSPPPKEPSPAPQEIYLERSLPAQSHLLVSESATEPETTTLGDDPAVVLAGKMTLSVISLDSSGNDEEIEVEEPVDGISAVTEQLFKSESFEPILELKDEIEEIIEQSEKIEPEVIKIGGLAEEDSKQTLEKSVVEKIPVMAEQLLETELSEPILEVQKEIEEFSTMEEIVKDEEQAVEETTATDNVSALTKESVKTELSEPTAKFREEVEEIIKQSEEIEPMKIEDIIEEGRMLEESPDRNVKSIDDGPKKEDDGEEVEEIEVEEIEHEVNDLIQEAIDNVLHRQNTSHQLSDLRVVMSDDVDKSKEEEEDVLESDEDEEIEEIEYGSSEEEIEIDEEEEEEDEDEELQDKNDFHLNGLSGPGSKDTTQRMSETEAENDVSEDEESEEQLEEDEEVIEAEEVEEIEDEPTNNINHTTGNAESED